MSRGKEWFEAFFDGIYTRVLTGPAYTTTAAGQADVVRRMLKLRKGQAVLDVPCGAGRITIPLARRGMVMTGVDLTAGYLRRAAARRPPGPRRRAVHPSRHARDRLRRRVRRRLQLVRQLRLFQPRPEPGRRHAHLSGLKPGGRFLLEGMNKSWILSHFLPSSEPQEVGGGVTISNRRRWDARSDTVVDTWTMTRGQQSETHTIRMQQYNAADLRKLLGKAGFGEVRLFGRDRLDELPGRLTRHSRRFLAVATKPGRRRR